MKDCAHYRILIESYVAGDLPRAELAELRAHAKDCPDCGELLALNRELLEAGEEIPEPDGFDLQDMRDEVLARIAGEDRVSRRAIAQVTTRPVADRSRPSSTR